jgi:hypothetical protein
VVVFADHGSHRALEPALDRFQQRRFFGSHMKL